MNFSFYTEINFDRAIFAREIIRFLNENKENDAPHIELSFRTNQYDRLVSNGIIHRIPEINNNPSPFPIKVITNERYSEDFISHDFAIEECHPVLKGVIKKEYMVYSVSIPTTDGIHLFKFISEKSLKGLMEDIKEKSELKCEKEVFPNDAMELKEKIIKFRSEETKKYFTERGLPLQTAAILSGPPGNGKTLFSIYLAESLGLERSSLSASEVIGAASNNSNLPNTGLVVLDDIDESLGARDNNGANIVLSWLLRQLDSGEKEINRIVFLITNVSTKIDNALKRPGRFEHEIKFNKPTEQQLVSALKFYLPTEINADFADVAKKIRGLKEISIAHTAYLARLLCSKSVNTIDEGIKYIKDYCPFNNAKEEEKMGF